MPKANRSEQGCRDMAPAITPEGQLNRCISLAYNLAEKRLANGTASSQETVQFLKAGSDKEQLELEKLRKENKLLQAKTEALESQKNIEILYKEAISALTNYSGRGDDDEY